MTDSRNLEATESILSASLTVTRPRAPLKSRAHGQSARHLRRSSWPVVGLPRRGLGNLRRGRKSWFPNRHPVARSATASSGDRSEHGATENSWRAVNSHRAPTSSRSRKLALSRVPLGLRTTGVAVLEEPQHLWSALYEDNVAAASVSKSLH